MNMQVLESRIIERLGIRRWLDDDYVFSSPLTVAMLDMCGCFSVMFF